MPQTAKIANFIDGPKLYQERARRALPLLVRQAEVRQPISYAALAAELGMPNPRNLNYPLGSIGQTLEALSKSWKEDIPPIQAMAVAKQTGLPGVGIGWFIQKKEDYGSLPKDKQQKKIDEAWSRVYAYPRWRDVLDALALPYSPPDFSRQMQDASALRGGGEGDAHRRLKLFVSRNPARIGLPEATANGGLEVRLPSGDVLDVSFNAGSDEWVAAEVKPDSLLIPDITRGLFQCVKYRAVMEAMHKTAHSASPSVRAVLASRESCLGSSLP